MGRRETGHYEINAIGGERGRAFTPHALPPSAPALTLDDALVKRVKAAEQALIRLELAGEMVPSLDWFIDAFVRKEAVLSSQIEGTQATLMDLLNYEAEPNALPPTADVEEICNYLDALLFARAQIASPSGLPLSIALLNDTHRVLMQGVRGKNRQPGEVRRSQNWLGSSQPSHAVYVPPPPHVLPNVLSDLERYIYADDDLPTIIRAGLLHVQFESIHPYLDGNGRMGRLLVTLLLEHWRLLTRPLLYLSLFFKRRRQEYYRRLNAVRTDGDWEGWLNFFLDGVTIIADEAVNTARDLFTLVTSDRQRVLYCSGASLLTAQLFDRLPGHPILTTQWVASALATTKPTAGRAIESLKSAGVLVEITGKQRDRIYAYKSYLDRLRSGTELSEDG